MLGDFRTNAIEMVQLLTSAASREHKNTADIQLTVDALEMVFSPVPPNVIVIVGGDRDYVPLVQKLKRYGIYVMGLGVEAGVSRVLIEACDSFVFYDDIVPPEPEDATEPVSSHDPAEAYSLMRRAVEALNRENRPTSGASVHAMMRQLAPAFDLARYRTTLKMLAQDAQEAGYINIIENPGSDFTLTASSSPDVPSTPAPESAEREYDYSTPAAMLASYRTILQERRIPLLSWRIRKEFMEFIWENFDDRGSIGMSFNAMRYDLMDYSDRNALQVSPQATQKLLYTLNFANCFSHSNTATYGNIIRIPAELHSPIYPVVDIEVATDKLHRRYLEILANDAVILDPSAVFYLLYGDEITDDEERAARSEVLTEMCNQIKPIGQFGQAYVHASRYTGSSIVTS